MDLMLVLLHEGKFCSRSTDSGQKVFRHFHISLNISYYKTNLKKKLYLEVSSCLI